VLLFAASALFVCPDETLSILKQRYAHRAPRMANQQTDYGILERLPSDIQYLKHVVWEATLLDEEALHDDNPEYTDKVMNAMRQQFQGLSPRQQVQEALRHRELIRQFTQDYPFNRYPETGALLFIHGLLTYAEGLFNKKSA
jgi:hypothetical protein